MSKNSKKDTPATRKSGISEFSVVCKFHTPGDRSYRIYAANEAHAEEIARIKFAEGGQSRILDEVHVSEVKER